MTVKLEWGLQPPAGYEGVAWGARAIYALRLVGRSVIDLLWDRQCAVGDAAEIKQLCSTLDMTALNLLREECTRQQLRGDEHRLVRIEVGDIVIEANPRESCGYLYIVAYRRQCVECKKGVPEHRMYLGVMGPFCSEPCREAYVNRPPTSTSDLLESYVQPHGERHPVTREPGYDGDEMAARARSITRDKHIPLHNIPAKKSTIGTPYKCNVPMCGESGVCDECRRRGAR